MNTETDPDADGGDGRDATPTPIRAADYRELIQVEQPRVGPDGDRVAFVRKVPDGDEEYETTVYVVSTDGEEQARQFTAAEGADAAPRWSPSGDRLAFTSARGDAETPQLWVVPIDGGEARRVTAVSGGVETPVWGPEGEHLAFVQRTTADERDTGTDRRLPDRPGDDDGEEAGAKKGPDEGDGTEEDESPDPRVIDRMIYRQGASYIDGERVHVYTLALDDSGLAAAGDGIERHTDGEYDHLAPEFGDDGTLYYAVKRGPEPDDSVVYDIDAVDPATGERETVATTTAWAPTLSATDGLLAYPRTPTERFAARQTEVEVLDRATGETTTPTATLDRTIVDLRLVAAAGDDDPTLCVLGPDAGAGAIRRLSPTGGDDGDGEATTGTVLAREPGSDIAAMDVGADGTVAFVRSTSGDRGDVYVHAAASTAGEAATRRLTTVNAAYLADHAVAEPEALTITVEDEGGDGDDHTVDGWLLTPPEGVAEPPYPLVVEIHGGPHAMWTTSGTMWHEFQTLAARGYAVLWSNPRGSTGYGEAFATAILDDWGATTMTDVSAGIDAVVDRPAIDADEIHVTGGSFGGFMTAWAITHAPDRFRSAVAQRGVYDLTGFYGSTDAFQLVEDSFDAVPWERPAFLWEQSPVSDVVAATAPTLVLHADADYRAPVNTAELFYLLLRKRGVTARLVRYPREGHELSRSGEPAHVVDRLERIGRWFDGYSDHVDVAPAPDRGTEGLSTAASGGTTTDTDRDDTDAGDHA